MDTATIELDRLEAGRLYRKYREHRAHQTPIDAEIQRSYKLIAEGKVVIRAIESVRAAGVGADGLPRLALCPADSPQVFCSIDWQGRLRFAPTQRQTWASRAGWTRVIDIEGFGPRRRETVSGEAVLPHIPPDIRPARALEAYWILWEAVWAKSPPRDPMLLRRIGRADLWLVVGAWDLTEIERAAMATRIR